MRFCLFRPFPDPYRRSMQLYGDRLAQHLSAELREGETLCDCSLRDPRLRSAARYWDQYVRYQRFSRAHAGDVNHVVDHGFGHLVYSLPPGRTVVTFHDSNVTRVSGVGWTTRMSFRYSLGGIRRAGCVVADSAVSRADLLAQVDIAPEKIRVVHPGVDRSFAPAADRDALRARWDIAGPTVLHVGHTQSYMNVPTVLRVVARLRRQGVEARLLKVGGAFTAPQASLIEREQLAPFVRHLGSVSPDALRELYNCADVLLYPVLYAGFGLPPLEAMASGTPVVASTSGALPEVVGDAALLADATDEDALAAAVARLLEDGALRTAMVARGIARARGFDWGETARGVIAIYRELADA